MGGRNLQGGEVAYLSSCEYLPFDDSRQIEDLLLCYFMRQPNLVHISPSIDLLSVALNCPTGTKRDIKAQQFGSPHMVSFMLTGQMKKVRRRIQWNFCDCSVKCMLENGISSLPCWIQLNGHWLPISPGVSLYLMLLVRPQVSKCLFSIIFQTDTGPTSTTTIRLKTNSKPGR